jgi:hypothetical protein
MLSENFSVLFASNLYQIRESLLANCVRHGLF